jgi:hypothetical protein
LQLFWKQRFLGALYLGCRLKLFTIRLFREEINQSRGKTMSEEEQKSRQIYLQHQSEEFKSFVNAGFTHMCPFVNFLILDFGLHILCRFQISSETEKSTYESYMNLVTCALREHGKLVPASGSLGAKMDVLSRNIMNSSEAVGLKRLFDDFHEVVAEIK